MEKHYKAIALVQWEFEVDTAEKNPFDLAVEQIKAALPPGFTLNRVSSLDRKKKGLHKVTLGEFAPDDVLPFITHTETKKEYTAGKKQYLVRMNSQRYFVFHANRKCVACGLEGTRMLLEMHPNDKAPHFNLYAEEDGQLVLLTKDHIQAKCFSGPNSYSNFQVLCSICNNLKGAAHLTIEGIARLRSIYSDNRGLGRKKLSNLLQMERAALSQPWLPAVPVKGIVAASDLIVLEIDGQLCAMTVYDAIGKGREIACVKEGSVLPVLEIQDKKIIVQFGARTYTVFEGHVIK